MSNLRDRIEEIIAPNFVTWQKGFSGQYFQDISDFRAGGWQWTYKV